MEIIRQTINLFRIRKDEKKASLLALLMFSMLNVLNIVRYLNLMNTLGASDWSKFIKAWRISGFDPLTYTALTKWGCSYNVFRHPLLAYFVWPFSKLNEGLQTVFGTNCAMIIAACLLVFFATYSFIFLNRIFKDIIGTRVHEAFILSSLTFSFAYIMLAAVAPDHFCPSMFCLVLTLYLCGRKLQRGKALNWWQTIVMFFFTAGISLNNGLKIFLMALTTRRKRFFRPGYLIVAVLLPSALMWGAARLSYMYFVWPKEVATKTKAKEKREALLERLQNKAIANVDARDTARIAFLKDSVKKSQEEKRDRRMKLSAYYKHTGKPIAKGEFMRWTDITTSRWDVATECLFGEGIMLHENYLLGDVLVNRPVIVRYNNWFNYIVEFFLVALFIMGVWYGRRSLFMLTALSMFLLDMALHMGLGFGINEIYIMSAHYLFVLPIAMGFLLVKLGDKWRKRTVATLAAVAAYLWIWNTELLIEYLFVL